MTITPSMLAAAHAVTPSLPVAKVREMLAAALNPDLASPQSATTELVRHRQELAEYAAATQETLRRAQGEIAFFCRVLADVGNALLVPIPDGAACRAPSDEWRLYGKAVRDHLPKVVETLPPVQSEPMTLNAMLHKLWTACVGLPGYAKEEWIRVEQQLGAAGLLDAAHKRARDGAV